MDQGWLEIIGPQGVHSGLGVIRQLNENAQRSYFTYHILV